MKAPVKYVPGFVSHADEAFRALREELQWERRPDAPRSEYYCNDSPVPYPYGQGRGVRTYEPRPWHPAISAIREAAEAEAAAKFEVCFLNRYLDQSDQLGWHSDDSPEMDDARPIAVVSLGVERDIMFREAARLPEGMSIRDMLVARVKEVKEGMIETLRLGHGSLCLMSPGMQDLWQHRIPKAGFKCGERISLTFRGYVGEK